MGLKITGHQNASDLGPELYDYKVYSDISDDEIDEDEIWKVDGQICSEEEMLGIFFDEYVSEVNNEDDYQKGKEWLIKVVGKKEEDFKNHPIMLKIDVPYGTDECQYALTADFDPVNDEYLPKDFVHLEVSDLEPDEENNPYDEY